MLSQKDARSTATVTFQHAFPSSSSILIPVFLLLQSGNLGNNSVEELHYKHTNSNLELQQVAQYSYIHYNTEYKYIVPLAESC